MDRENTYHALLDWLLVVLVVLVLVLGFMWALTGTSSAQTDDFIQSGSVSPYVTLGRGLTWAGSGFQTVGQNFIFHPVDANQGFCLFIYNNNPSNSHTVTVTVGQTGDPSVQTYQTNTSHWTSVPTQTAFPVTVPATSLIGINYKTTASAGVVISFTGNAGAAGSPDTADIFTVQTNQSACGGIPFNSVQGLYQQGVSISLAQQFPVLIGGVLLPGSTSTVQMFAVGPNGNGFVLDSINSSLFGNGLFASPVANSASPVGVKIGGVTKQIVEGSVSMAGFGPGELKSGAVRTNVLEMATDLGDFAPNATPAFTAFGALSNPGAGTTILHSFNQTAATKNLAYKWLILSCSAACSLQINRTSSQGTTCSALTVRNMQIGNNGTNLAPAATDVAENNCTGAPTSTFVLYGLFLPAGAIQQLDIGGILNATGNSAGAGIDVINITAIASGAVNATLQWVEQ